MAKNKKKIGEEAKQILKGLDNYIKDSKYRLEKGRSKNRILLIDMSLSIFILFIIFYLVLSPFNTGCLSQLIVLGASVLFLLPYILIIIGITVILIRFTRDESFMGNTMGRLYLHVKNVFSINGLTFVIFLLYIETISVIYNFYFLIMPSVTIYIVIIIFLIIIGIGISLLNFRLLNKEAIKDKRLQHLKSCITEDDIRASKEQHLCIVHKGVVKGYNYICSCKTSYCFQCYMALIDIENVCWVCEEPLDVSKPIAKDLETSDNLSVIDDQIKDNRKNNIMNDV